MGIAQKSRELEARAGQLVEAAKKAGADHCDCFVSQSQSLGISVRDGEIENTDRAESDDYSLRVFCGDSSASVSANQSGDLTQLCERAVAMARVSPPNPFVGLAPRERMATEIPDVELFDSKIPQADELTQSALACEDAGMAVNGVTKSMGASAGWGMTGFVLATSDGFSGSFNLSRFSLSTAMIAGEGTAMERDYDFHSTTHIEDLRSAVDIGKRAGERTVKRLNPRQVKSGSFPVIFDKRQSGSIVSSLAGAINGASIARKTSFLRDDLGKQICRPDISIICDPLRPRGLGSRPVDGEGIATSLINFIDKGVLMEWVLDCASANELGLQSNARAARSGAGTSPSTTNLYMTSGEATREDFLAQIGTGLYLTDTIGHGLNMVTGDYSKGAGGFWVENGEIAFPVSEITIAANLRDIYANMIAADDLEFVHATNAPTILVEEMTIGGK